MKRVTITPKSAFWHIVETTNDVRILMTAGQYLLDRWAHKTYLCADDNSQYGRYRVQESWTGPTMCVYVVSTADGKSWDEAVIASWESVELVDLPAVKVAAIMLAAWLNGFRVRGSMHKAA